MAKAVVVFATLAAASVLLLLLLLSPKNWQPNGRDAFEGPHAQIRRLGFQMMSPIFDPVMAKVQRIAEEKAAAAAAAAKGSQGGGGSVSSTTSTSSTKLEEQEKKYFNDDGTLNLRLRLMVLFPFLDRSPQDGMLETKELEVWLTQQAIDRLHYRTKRELEFRDIDGDGAVSFSEYFPDFTQEDIERNEMGHGQAGWWMEQFKNADVDRNGILNLYEFRDFLHPEDSRNENIQKWMLTEKIRHMDENRDQRLNLDEFVHGIYNAYKRYVEYESSRGDYIPTASEVFTKLDVDKDNLLRVEELKPLFRYMCVGELVYAKHYAIFLIQEADDNRDGKLTVDEMLNHEHIFFNTVYDNGKDDQYHSQHGIPTVKPNARLRNLFLYQFPGMQLWRDLVRACSK